MARISIIAPESRRKELEERLRHGGFETALFADGRGFEISKSDILLIDPGDNGSLISADVGAAINGGEIPVVVIMRGSSRFPPELLTGVSDMLFEPFTDKELDYRLAKSIKIEPDAGAISIGGLSIHPDTYEVRVDGQSLELTYKEYELLKFLAENEDRVWTRQALLNQVWAYDYYGGARTVDVHIRRLRSKLGSRYAGLIKTVRQVGYKLSRS